MRTTIRQWTLLCATALLGTAAAQDAFLSNASLPRYIKAGTNYDVAMRVKNNGPGFVTSFSVRWRLDGGSWNNGTTVNITPPGLQTGGYYMPHTHQTPLNTTQGVHTLEINLVVSGDNSPANNTLLIPFTALTTWSPKVVLLESRTETWCPQCPPSNDETNILNQEPAFAVAKFHLSDALDDCSECVSYYNDYNINYTPAGLIELGEYGGYEINSQWPGWGPDMTARAEGVSPVQLTMNSSLNWTTRVMTVTLTADFSYVVPGGSFKMNVYAVENNVPGPQENASPGYIHQRVMRGMLGGVAGTSGVIPNTPVVGADYTQTYTWTVPAGFKLGDIRLIGLVEHDLGAQGRYALNAVKSSASPVGMEEAARADRLVVYPNPFTSEIAVTMSGIEGLVRAELIGMDGRLMLTHGLNLQGDRPVRIDLDGKDIPAGAYVLRLITEEGTLERTVLKAD